MTFPFSLLGQESDKTPVLVGHNKPIDKKQENHANLNWRDVFQLVQIQNQLDSDFQAAYFYKAVADQSRPLVVSLHTWSGNYQQFDPLAELCVENDYNYIHPNFRGPNRTEAACCSELAISDIDEAISFAIDHARAKPSNIYLIGLSGGGYATLCMLMRSKHKIKKYSAWVPVSDLEAWYKESSIKGNQYQQDILNCTSSDSDELDVQKAKGKSPINWKAPSKRLTGVSVSIFAGAYDGIIGSVPITHSINFYNKLIKDLKGCKKHKVSNKEKLWLLENREPIGEFGNIGDRKVFLQKQYKGIKLTVFEGGHEMLPEFALKELFLEN